MRRTGCYTALFALCAICLLLLRTADAQTPAQTGAQTGGGLIPRTPESVEQSRREERKITVDVQVKDVSGKSVAGLQQQDVTLLDSGHPVPITSFREIDGRTSQPPTEVILLVDVMNASFQDVVLERQGIEKFLRQNDGHLALPVSIVFLADTGVKLNKPSRDGEALAQDLKKLQTPMRVLNPAQGAEGAQDRSQRSLRALQSLSTYEASKPGRKLLIWVGPGWPLLSRSTAELSAQDQSRYFHSIVDLTTNLRRAHITLYNVAPLNLAQFGGQNPFLYEAYLKGVEKPTQADSTNLALQIFSVHSGGLVLSKSGDLAGEIALCATDGEEYYEVTFDAPEDEAIRYHTLQLKFGQPKIKARTSTAYYAGGPQSTP